MAYTEKFQQLADIACGRVQAVQPEQVDQLVAQGAVALDIRDKEERDCGHIDGSMHISRGRLEMDIEGKIPDLTTLIMCYCNANNRGALSASALKDMGYINAQYISGGFLKYRKLKL
ncbi:rhodanese-like domain-containing protein [Dasania marina]|uniref:rhodanese-like domain-containing protein n=1 Tax=Dasania marina TaxID=471499 RepID=UPI00037A7BD4|nr:rhodanese-like domain-containing protein [Dasania marina]